MTKGDNPGVRKPRKEIRSHRCKNHQQNIRDRRISDAEDTIENIDTTVNENVKSKNLLTPKHPRSPGHNEKMKLKDNRYKKGQRFPTQRASKYPQQNYRRKLP
jgi:Ni/Co efflux regulator RcnB